MGPEEKGSRAFRMGLGWKKVYLVQADEEIGSGGHDPVKEHTSRTYHATAFTPRTIKRVIADDAARFGKIKNVITYIKLGLPTRAALHFR